MIPWARCSASTDDKYTLAPQLVHLLYFVKFKTTSYCIRYRDWRGRYIVIIDNQILTSKARLQQTASQIEGVVNHQLLPHLSHKYFPHENFGAKLTPLRALKMYWPRWSRLKSTLGPESRSVCLGLRNYEYRAWSRTSDSMTAMAMAAAAKMRIRMVIHEWRVWGYSYRGGSKWQSTKNSVKYLVDILVSTIEIW